jgi:hypothetical protein
MQGGLRNLIGLLLVTSASVGASYGQDSDKSGPGSTETQVVAGPEGNQVKSENSIRKPQLTTEPERKTLYFIGPRVSGQRQEGPAVGTPRLIMPKPYVPVGSLTVPPPQDTGRPAGENIQEFPETSEDSETLAPVDTDTTLTSDIASDDGVDDDAARDELSPESLNDGDDPFSEATLGQIDPSGLAVPEAEPLDTVWQGYTREEIIAFLQKIAHPTQSPALSRLSGAIAASRFAVPAPEDDASVIEFIEARLAAFETIANIDGYTGLINILPRDRDWTALAPQFVKSHLLKGELAEACFIAENRRAEENNPYWIKLTAFCMAASGNRVGLDFQLGVLEETVTIEPVFYQLLDQILIEAELPPGSLIPQPMPLGGPLPTDVLTASMARLSRAVIDDVTFDGLSPLAIPLLLENPSLSRSAQIKLVGFLMSRGIADGGLVKVFAQNLALVSGDAEAALAKPAVYGDAVIVAGANGSSEIAVPAPDEDASIGIQPDQIDSVLLALVAGAPSADLAHAALARLWERAGEEGRVATLAPVIAALSPLVADTLEPDALMFDNIGVMARANALVGNTAEFNAFVRRLRVGPQGENFDRDRALISLWPMLALTDDDIGSQVSDMQLSLWMHQISQMDTNTLKANLLLPTLEVFDGAVSDEMWQKLAGGTIAFDGKSISPAFWRSLIKNAEERDPIKTLESVYDLMAEMGPVDLPPEIVGTVINSLRLVGLDAAAKAFALEVLVSQGV